MEGALLNTIGGGGASDGYIGYVGADPVTGLLVRSGELAKSTPAEVTEYLKQYNELDGDEKDKDGTAGAASEAGTTTRGASTGATSGVTSDEREKNSEGRAREAAPVASAGSGPHRKGGVPKAG